MRNRMKLPFCASIITPYFWHKNARVSLSFVLNIQPTATGIIRANQTCVYHEYNYPIARGTNRDRNNNNRIYYRNCWASCPRLTVKSASRSESIVAKPTLPRLSSGAHSNHWLSISSSQLLGACLIRNGRLSILSISPFLNPNALPISLHLAAWPSSLLYMSVWSLALSRWVSAVRIKWR